MNICITYSFFNSIGFLHTMAAILQIQDGRKKNDETMNNYLVKKKSNEEEEHSFGTKRFRSWEPEAVLRAKNHRVHLKIPNYTNEFTEKKLHTFRVQTVLISVLNFLYYLEFYYCCIFFPLSDDVLFDEHCLDMQCINY